MAVTVGMAAVGLATAAGSIGRLTGHMGSKPIPIGVVLASVSVVVLAWLAGVKLRTARVIPSRALRADGWVSATGALLALVTVTGTGLTGALGLW